MSDQRWPLANSCSTALACRLCSLGNWELKGVGCSRGKVGTWELGNGKVKWTNPPDSDQLEVSISRKFETHRRYTHSQSLTLELILALIQNVVDLKPQTPKVGLKVKTFPPIATDKFLVLPYRYIFSEILLSPPKTCSRFGLWEFISYPFSNRAHSNLGKMSNCECSQAPIQS